MRIAVLGRTGQLAQSFRDAGLKAHFASRAEADLATPGSVQNFLEGKRPDLILNTAAYTNVEKAEDERDLCFQINSHAIGEMSRWAKKNDSHVVHFSTDYVFDGSGKSPWKEVDRKQPLNQYGLSKSAGEDELLASGCKSTLFRVSWLYSPYGKNFVKTMLHAASQRDELRVVNDQFGSPTSALQLARLLLPFLTKMPLGIFHLTSSPIQSWWDFTKRIVHEAEKVGWPLRVKNILPVSAIEYPTRAVRPLNSCMDSSLFEKTFAVKAPLDEEGLAEVVHLLNAARLKL